MYLNFYDLWANGSAYKAQTDRQTDGRTTLYHNACRQRQAYKKWRSVKYGFRLLILNRGVHDSAAGAEVVLLCDRLNLSVLHKKLKWKFLQQLATFADTYINLTADFW